MFSSLLATLAVVIATASYFRPARITIITETVSVPAAKASSVLPEGTLTTADLELPPFLQPRTDFDFLNSQPGRN